MVDNSIEMKIDDAYDSAPAEVGITRERLTELLETEAKLQAAQAEAEAWKKAAQQAGVCMTCALGLPDPIGCTDCLGTGWDGGAPVEARVAQAEAAELRKAVAPLAALQIPKSPQGNAGAYSIRFADIERAQAALSASPAPALAVINAALEVKTHIAAWRNALTIAKVRAQENGDDEAAAYWAHEERAGLRDGGALVVACDAYTKHTGAGG